MPLIPALGRQRQMDLCEFKASLVYKVSSKTARTVSQRNPVSKNNSNNNNNKKWASERLSGERYVVSSQKPKFDSWNPYGGRREPTP